jgi:hypothetical protein
VEHQKSLKMSVVQPRKGDVKGAKLAITHYRVLDRLPGYTVVEVKLETGRRNQIRVQFADRGFPLLGDQVYGSKTELLDRQALHAELLGFRHPVTTEAITVTSPLPSDIERALKILRTQRRVERAEAGVKGEEGIYKPKITKDRKFDRVLRAQRFSPEGDARPAAAAEGEKKPIRRGRDSFAKRPEGEARPQRPRTGPGERPSRPGAERPARPDGERPARPSGGRPSRPGADRPARSSAARPSAGRPRGAKPAAPRPKKTK